MFCFGFSSGLLFETELMKCRHASNIFEAGTELILCLHPQVLGFQVCALMLGSGIGAL